MWAVDTEREFGGAMNPERPDGGQLNALLQSFTRLDQLLDRAVALARAIYGPEAEHDPFRGLHLGEGQVRAELALPSGVPRFGPGAVAAEALLADSLDPTSPLFRLKAAFGLSLFDLDLLLIALAPELDLRYERVYAFLQDDVTRRRPTVDLALNLLCVTASEKIARRAHFSSHAPLVRLGVIQLVPDANPLQPPLLAHYLKLDERIVRFLIDEPGSDRRLEAFCRFVKPTVTLDSLVLPEPVKRGLRTLVDAARQTGEPLTFNFHGPRGGGKERTAEALAGELGKGLMRVKLGLALAAKLDFHQAVRLACREALLQDAVLYLEAGEVWRAEDGETSFAVLLDALAEYAPGLAIVVSEHPGMLDRGHSVVPIPVPFTPADAAQRRIYWAAGVAQAGMAVPDHDLDALSQRFRLTPAQIAEAVVQAGAQARWRRAVDGTGEGLDGVSGADLFAAARAQSSQGLAALARKIESKHTWADIMLPDDALVQLRELCQRVAHRHRVFDDWGFARKLALGTGVNALFAGPSGTGKTMAAEIISAELGLDLYRIDLSQVVSKYIGETEKNLSRVFAAAENANAILFFDEADALFGKRSEVHDAHDRYANIEIAYLLQKMEEYDGLAILATNLSQNLDDAFARRLAFTIHFPFPDEVMRRRIWASVWPAEAPLSEDLHLDLLAGRFRLSGGNIRNVALAASFLAAADGGQVSLAHVLQATQREYQKLGRVASDAEFGALAGGSA